jgi:multidrug efflux system outer membrane protein
MAVDMGAVKLGRTFAALALAGTALAGCDMAPAYHPQTPAVPQQFAELPGWQAAEPMDALPRGKWWEAFGDPQLNALEEQADKASPTLAAALARYDAATAAARSAPPRCCPRWMPVDRRSAPVSRGTGLPRRGGPRPMISTMSALR